MKMASELAYNMFKASSVFSFVSAGLGDVLAIGSSFKNMDAWIEKAEALELKCPCDRAERCPQNVKKWYKISFDSVGEKACQMEKYQKYAEALKTLQDEVVGLRHTLNNALQYTMQELLKSENKWLSGQGSSTQML
ncbi:unnamed protein product [Vicia faba]|uniref:Uncharacterized protein n=1 Tax=Vicia faba TaxID=3906 RepID=A0AAV1AS87_VICFA|nr:unnamed protein product [Vicia faba]